jgi:hypothetical protein
MSSGCHLARWMLTLFLLVPLLTVERVDGGRAQESDLVLEQRTIEIEGMRPVGLSPDSRWLAATTFGMDELCVYDIETLATQSCANLESLDARLRFEDVSWSPDSTRLVLAERSFIYFRDGDLWVMDALTGELTNVTDDDFRGSMPLGESEPDADLSFDVAPTWTPDGSGITYSRSIWIDGEMQGNDIVTIPAEGGEVEQLTVIDRTRAGVAYYGMEWTRDGETLYYSVDNYEQQALTNGIYRYERSTGTARQILTPTDERGAPALLQVNAKGTHLLVWYPRAAGAFTNPGSIYQLFDLETMELIDLVVPGDDVPDHAWVNTVTFSPNGESLLMTTLHIDPPHQAWVMEIDTGETVQLVEELPGAEVMEVGTTPSWTEGGLIFIASTIGSGTLLRVAPEEAPVVTPPTADPRDILIHATPQATPIPVEGAFSAGDVAYVNDADVALRAAPSPESQVVLRLDFGSAVTVLGAAEESDGFRWIPVQDQATRTIGFVQEEFLSAEPIE